MREKLWTSEQDERLLRLAKDYPPRTKGRWILIAEWFADKTRSQCESHYYQIKKPAQEKRPPVDPARARNYIPGRPIKPNAEGKTWKENGIRASHDARKATE